MVKSLTVSNEAYERLASRKEPGESFSTVINKLTGKASLMDIAGVLSGDEAINLEKNIMENRKRMNERIQKTAKELR